MATLKAIRRRIASVKSTQQITRAMKLIAAARLRRSQEALFSARPYHEALARVADSLLASERESMAPDEGGGKNTLLVVIASDRGLCGGYNVNVIRKSEEEARRLRGEGREVNFFAVGRKPLDHFRRTGAPLAGDRVNNTPRLATLNLARALSARVLADYRTRKFSMVGLVYSHFRHAASQEPLVEPLLPVEPPRENAKASQAASTDYLIEPSAAELVPFLMRTYVESAIFHALLEAEASFYGAQMTAMDAATNNASEMIDQYTLDMNRARQAQITKELMDIVGGAEALRG